ncbi:MAG: protein kinase, partial [Anaerolinea sp.]|nr:protein kinase [Anaerolinea sp.]
MTNELIGKRIGGYEIRDVLGRGGMATVYRAYQVSMNRLVAIKILPRQFLNDDTYLQRFEREVQIVSQLEHRNIVPVHDYGEFEGQPYIVMRYMPGGSVDDLVRAGPLPAEQIVNILNQIAPALDYAHSRGVLHRDLKPSNVLMDDDGGAFLTDFGIARILGEGAGATITTSGVVGTPSYMSPEQAQGKPLDARSDIYALGVMLFEMATGRRPFEGDTPYSIAVQQVTMPPPRPRSLNPELSSAVESVILTAMAKTPDSRYPDAVTLAEMVSRAFHPPGGSLHDTQTGIRRPEVEATVPTTPPPDGALADMVSSPPIPLPPVYVVSPAAPVTPGLTPGVTGSAPAVSAGSSGGMRAVPVVGRRRKRGPGWLFSAAIGGGVGCALLIILLAGIALVVALLLRSDRDAVQAAATARAAGTPAEDYPPPLTAEPGLTGGLIPTLGPNSIAGGALISGPAATPGAIRSGTILYTSDRDDNFDIYLLDLATDSETRLTFSPAVDLSPALSPDGERVAFVSDRDGDFDLYVIDRSGENLLRLTDNTVVDRAPTWSPDGAWIVFSTERANGAHSLYRVRPDGTDLTEIFGDDRRATDPAFTSDGRYLLFTYGLAADPSTWEIARLDLITLALVRLTSNAVRDWSPVSLPDGSVLYSTDGEGYAGIARLTPSGTRAIVFDSIGYDWG